MFPASGSETLVSKVTIAHLVAEFALLNERMGGPNALAWSESFKARVISDIEQTALPGISPAGAKTMLKDATKRAERMFERIRYGLTFAKAG